MKKTWWSFAGIVILVTFASIAFWVHTQEYTPSLAQVQEPFYETLPTIETLPKWDIKSDDSLQKFLDTSHAFQNLEYEPEDLLPINSDFTSNSARNFKLRKEAGVAFADMARHFRDHFKGKKKLSLISAYRSYHYQKGLNKRCLSTHCAEAGTSEHQAGLAVDLGVNGRALDKASFDWLKTHAHLRGFHNTYQKGVVIDGKIIEPRHWRYLWIALATELYEWQYTFAEWKNKGSSEDLTIATPINGEDLKSG